MLTLQSRVQYLDYNIHVHLYITYLFLHVHIYFTYLHLPVHVYIIFTFTRTCLHKKLHLHVHDYVTFTDSEFGL